MAELQVLAYLDALRGKAVACQAPTYEYTAVR